MKVKKKYPKLSISDLGATGTSENNNLTPDQAAKLTELLYPLINGTPGVSFPGSGIGTFIDIAKRRFSDNFNPTGVYSSDYESLVDEFSNAILYDQPQFGSHADGYVNSSEGFRAEASDLLELMLFGKQRYNSLPVSEYSPTITSSSESGALGKIFSEIFSSDPVYYSSPSTEAELRGYLESSPNRIFEYPVDASDSAWLDEPKLMTNLLLGDYTVSTGKDDKGTYLSYYDEWDLNPLAQLNPNLKSLEDAIYSPFFTPAEVYGRVYYNPKEINLDSPYTPSFRVNKKIKTDEN